MDSEDERETLKGYGFQFSGALARPWEGPHCRLFQAEEWRDHLTMQSFSKPGQREMVAEYINDDYRVRHRVARFFQTIKGFHTGQLDLTGRHKFRYDALMKRWTSFVKDLDELRRHAISIELEEDPMRKLYRLNDDIWFSGDHGFVVDPPSLLKDFHEKWKTGTKPLTVGALFEAKDRTMAYIEKNPEPIFQKLCLHDLPPEIIHYLFEPMEKESARILGETSRLFREFSLPYIFRELNLTTRVFIDPMEAGPVYIHDSDDDDLEYIIDGREAVVEKASFAASHPRILEGLQCLTVANDSPLDLLDNTEEGKTYHETLYSVLRVILSQAKKLRVVKFVFLPLPLKLYEAIMTLPNLHTLIMIGCSANYKTTEPRPFASSSSVTNLFVGILDTDIWWLVPNIKNIRVMSITSIRSEEHDRNIVPPQQYINTINPFQALEKLCIFDLRAQDVPKLISWVKTTNQNAPLYLTHLKLSGEVPFSLRILPDILSTFGTPTMQYLTLRAVADAPPPLLKHLAKAFPNLISLTLTLSNQESTSGASVIWPHSCAGYAAMLSEFHCLRYFRWNHNLGFANLSDRSDGERALNALQDDAKTFATKVPSLEYIDFSERGMSALGFRIRRNDSGDVSLDISFRLNFDPYDPDPITAHTG